MNDPLCFKTRDEFRDWLLQHGQTNEGVWLLFSKSDEVITLKANEALEEALCYGWIDGLMKRIDDDRYKKYFSMRRKNSKWSQKNKAIVVALEKQGRMTDFGRAKIEEAKKNGQWDMAGKRATITDDQMNTLCDLLKDNKLAYENFQHMSQSVKDTYVRAYLDAKTDKGRIQRLAWICGRLEKNLKPM